MLARLTASPPTFIDIETYSALDVREVGTYRYFEHPSTRVLVIRWVTGIAGPIQEWLWTSGEPRPLFENQILVAHNAEFEKASGIAGEGCTWLDTAAQAAMCGLPRALGKAADALGLPVKKNPRGARLIQLLSKPQRPSKARPFTLPHEKHANYAELLAEFSDYCADDVEVCRELYYALPPLPPTEAAIYDLTAKINARGVLIDRLAVERIRAFLDHITGDRGARIKELTGGLEHTQLAALQGWLADQGVEMEAMDKAHVSAALRRSKLPPAAREVLELRQALGKSSTAKLDAMLARACDDGRVRGNLIYHGAATGRWTGAGLQVQNMPRSDGMDMEGVVAALCTGDAEWVDALYGMSPVQLASKAVRGLLVAPEGAYLMGADFSSIEARGILWLADDPGLDILRRGEDIYVDMARDISADATRQLGKQVVLGCGFQMGAERFEATCKGYGMEVDSMLASRAVMAYRDKFYRVPQFWSALEAASLAAMHNPGKAYRVDRGPGVTYRLEGTFLTCRLPSGRKLYYPFPEVQPGKYGLKLTYMGIDSMTKAWRREDTYGGKLAENVTQAVARDLLATTMLRLEEAGYPLVFSVHDEPVCEVQGLPDEALRIAEIMCELPEWARGFPIAAESFCGKRYS